MSAGALCGPSGWRVYEDHPCPWCLERRRCLVADVFEGYCGFESICGTCGSAWSVDDGYSFHKVTEEQRDENVARVAAAK